MKTLFKATVFIVALLFIIAFSSCAKDNYSHNYKKSSKSYSTSGNAVSKKHTPISKNYAISNKKKTILGQSGTYRR